MELERNISAREMILGSIRKHLSTSEPLDPIHAEVAEAEVQPPAGAARPCIDQSLQLTELFKQKLEEVGGHCVMAGTDSEVVTLLVSIISKLRVTPLRARRIALSNAPGLESFVKQIEIDVDEIAVCPGPAELFGYDVGVSTAQAAIAETGTLVLESQSEKHRLVSLVPPVHIAIVEASNIVLTLGEALAAVHGGGLGELSPTITFITGPSRTADIELTLAIGVHGPQELYVIVKDGLRLTADEQAA
jgi:L-lactate dehydrogenase complex protein LldG